MKALATHHKGGKHHNLTRSDHHGEKGTKKYVRQAVRTDRNKTKHRKIALEAKKVADKRKAGMKAWATFAPSWPVKGQVEGA